MKHLRQTGRDGLVRDDNIVDGYMERKVGIGIQVFSDPKRVYYILARLMFSSYIWYYTFLCSSLEQAYILSLYFLKRQLCFCIC